MKEKRFERIVEDKYRVDNLWWIVILSLFADYVSFIFIDNLEYPLAKLFLIAFFCINGLFALGLIFTNYTERKVYYKEIK